MAAPELVTSEAIGVPGGVASADVSVLTTQAEPGLANATNLGDLSSGLLKIIVTLGVATILNANIADTAHACVLTTAGPTALTLPTTGTLAVLSDIPAPYTLPIAAAGSLGGIRVGSGLSIDGDGILSATGGGSGTVTSVGLALPSSEFDTTGGTNPVTGSGTLTGTWKTQTANYGFMGPASGAAAAPAFRALVAADIPGSTVGKAVLALTNPDAVSFPRFNADNTVTALSDANFRTAIGAGTSSFDGAYASLSGKPTLGTASAQDVGYFATAAQAFPGFGTTHALAAYGDHAHAGVYEPVIGYTPAQATVSHADAHTALAVGPQVLTGLSHGLGSSNYTSTYGCGLAYDRSTYTGSSCQGSFRFDSPTGGSDFYLDKLITYTDPATQVWTGPQKIWTDYNDGASSGLNADLLDGNHASAFALTAQTMYIGTTAVAINRGSGSLTLAGLTFTTPNIGAATGTSLALGASGTTNYTTMLNGNIYVVGSTTGAWARQLGYTDTSGTLLGGFGALGSYSAGEPTLAYLWIGPSYNDTAWSTRFYPNGDVRVYGLTASRVVLTDASKNLVSSTITSTQLEALNGAITSSPLTMNTARMLGRRTAGDGSIEEISVSGNPAGAVALETDVASGTWTPAFTNLTVVDGTGGATYTGGYVRIGNIVNWWAKIATTGTCTTASTFTATILNNLPFSSVSPSVCHAVRSSTGGGSISEPGWTQAGTDNAYMPSWAAYDGDIYISGVIFLV